MEFRNQRVPYAAAMIKLLKGPVYADDKNVWRELLGWQTAIQEYFGKIGLELVITEQDGFARVLQPEAGEDDENPLPRLMKKQSLNYEATVLAVMLREGLEEFDVRSDKIFSHSKGDQKRPTSETMARVVLQELSFIFARTT